MNIYDKINNKTATLADQDEALKDPCSAYEFARIKIPGSDIEACQKIACQDPCYAYYFAFVIPDADIEYCQEHACKRPHFAYWFAEDIFGADLKCSLKACENDDLYCELMEKLIVKRALK